MDNLQSLEAVLHHDAAIRHFIGTLNRNEMEDLSGEVFAHFYWLKRNPGWFKRETRKKHASLRKAQRIIKKRLATDNVSPEWSEGGSVVERIYFPMGDTLDFAAQHLKHPGWNVVFQDCGFSGYWENDELLRLCTYCEGDVQILHAPNQDVYTCDRRRLDSWYTENV